MSVVLVASSWALSHEPQQDSCYRLRRLLWSTVTLERPPHMISGGVQLTSYTGPPFSACVPSWDLGMEAHPSSRGTSGMRGMLALLARFVWFYSSFLRCLIAQLLHALF